MVCNAVSFLFTPGENVRTIWGKRGFVVGAGWFRGDVFSYYVQDETGTSKWYAPEVLIPVESVDPPIEFD